MKNWSLKKQLYTFLLFFVIFPFICIILFLYSQFKTYSMNLSINHMKTEANFVTKQLDTQFEAFDKLTNSIYKQDIFNGSQLNSEALFSAINRLVAENSSIKTAYIDNFDTIQQVGSNYEQTNDFFTSYRSEIIKRNGKLTWLKPVKALDPSGRHITLVSMGRSIRNQNYTPIGVLWIFVDSEILTSLISNSSTFTLSNNYFIYNDEIIFSYDNVNGNFDSDEIGKNLSNIATKKIYSEKFILVEKKSHNNQWHFVSLFSAKNILTDFNVFVPLFLIIIVIYVFFILFLQFFLKKHFFSPINHLSKSIKKMSEGDFNSYVPTKGIQSGEIFNLISVYNYMVTKIKELMQTVKEKEREKNQYKSKMLNLQISPHFIYNTLNTIKMVATINKQVKVASLVDSLIVVLKSLTKSKENNTIEDEIILIESYSEIQKARYANFNISINAAEDTLNLKLPQYILQPIIENAIIHGFTEDILNGIIEINIWRSDNLYITVKDNGVGFDEHKLTKGKNAFHSNIGLTVVKQIIQLECGEKFGFTILSNEPQIKGTLVSYKLPIIEGDNDDEYHDS